MIGSLVNGDGVAVAVLDDDGRWRPAPDVEPELLPLAEAQAKVLNVTHSPLDHQVGDHHLPFGVMAMNRAAYALRLRVELSAPIPKLPDGAIA